MIEQPAPLRVGNLKKIDLKLEIRQEGCKIAPPVELNFIYGIGTHGLTPLELQLVDQAVGATVNLDCKVNELASVFEHLAPLNLHLPLDGSETLHLVATVQGLTIPTDREIVQAIAEMARCGDCCGH